MIAARAARGVNNSATALDPRSCRRFMGYTAIVSDQPSRRKRDHMRILTKCIRTPSNGHSYIDMSGFFRRLNGEACKKSIEVARRLDNAYRRRNFASALRSTDLAGRGMIRRRRYSIRR